MCCINSWVTRNTHSVGRGICSYHNCWPLYIIYVHHCVPQPQFPVRRGSFGDSAINKDYIAYFQSACTNLPDFCFWSEIWCHYRVLWPKFPIWLGGIPAICKYLRQKLAYLCLHGFSGPFGLMAVLAGMGDGVVWLWPQQTRSYFWGVVTSLPLLAQIDQEMRQWECTWTDRHMLWWRQTELIICPLLYAIGCLQCFDCWLGGRKGIQPVKNGGWWRWSEVSRV